MMFKKLLTFLIICCGVTAASAQNNKGDFYLGGSASYSYDSYGTSNNYSFTTGYTVYTNQDVTNFSISPEIGYFISKKWSIGIQPSFSRASGYETSSFYSYTSPADNSVSSDNYHSDIIGIGINVRYYWMITDKIGIFPQMGISSLNNSVYLKYGTFSIGASPNVVFFPTPRLGVNLGFGQIAYNLDYQTKQNTINAALNNNITFGLNYYFRKK